jgi:16S rRNA (adenine1518-N6/adenine1519-N6)-dimethyltransferase
VQTLSEIKDLLASRGLAPTKRLGQNFLVDQNLLRRLVEAAGVGPGDVVLEVGPGTGTLTEELLDRGCEVVACELDRGLADLLRERLGGRSAGRFTLVEGDCLAGKRAVNPEILAAIGGRPFRLVANLPYGAATPLMLTLLVDHPACSAMHVTIQREVADRLRAAPGTKEYGELSIVAQALAELERICLAPPECFWPRPQVTSEMLSVRRRRTALTNEPHRLQALCRRLFTKRRKQIGAILGRATPLPPGVPGDMRPENLTVEAAIALAAALPADGDQGPSDARR